MRAKLCYADASFDVGVSGATYLTYQVFSGNSIHDPDVTGVGVQPYYFDEYQAVYERYCVSASKIKLCLFPMTATSTAPYLRVFLFLFIVSSIFFYTEANDLRQIAGVKEIIVNRDQLFNLKSTTISGYRSTRGFRALSTPLDLEYTSTFGTSSAKRWYWHIITMAPDVGVDQDCYGDVQIDYYCTFDQLKDPNES